MPYAKAQLIFVLFLLVLLTAVPTIATTLFEDDFESGPDPEWLMPDGGWECVDGRLLNTSTCGYQVCIPDLWCGGAEQFNYMVSFDVCVLSSTSSHGTALYVRAMMSAPHEPQEGTTSGYSVDVGWSSSGDPSTAGGNIHRLDSSEPTYLVQANQGERCWFEPGVVYHIKFGRVGGQIVVNKWEQGTSEPAYLMAASDADYNNGYWSIGFWHGLGWIDNVVVTGDGTVSVDSASWGELKALFR